MNFVLSTVGTSSLTNAIDRREAEECSWGQLLRDSANLKREELQLETAAVIDTLAERALEKLIEADIPIHRRASAELNGIYGIYNGQLPQNSQDEHTLICTDTAQGQVTGDLLKDFLADQGLKVNIVTPPQLSTRDTASFTAGVKELIKWLEGNVLWRRERGYHVVFNLVGGFKSLQGYMNTFGAFYADEVIYIFEAPTAELIRIPKLPIQIDTTVIQKALTKFALMSTGRKYYSIQELEGIPETLLEFVEDNDTTVAGLSTWGELLWHRTKAELLKNKLLELPRVSYQQSFKNDCRDLDTQARVKLVETLAGISAALEDSNGDTTQLNKNASGLNFERLTNLKGTYTFRITDAIRVSCEVAGGSLVLRRYGQHDDVYRSP